MGLDILNLQFFKGIFVSIVEIFGDLFKDRTGHVRRLLQCFEGFKLLCISNFSN